MSTTVVGTLVSDGRTNSATFSLFSHLARAHACMHVLMSEGAFSKVKFSVNNSLLAHCLLTAKTAIREKNNDA